MRIMGAGVCGDDSWKAGTKRLQNVVISSGCGGFLVSCLGGFALDGFLKPQTLCGAAATAPRVNPQTPFPLLS